MPAIRKNEAMEKLALAVEGTSSDNLADYYGELFPEKVFPKGATAKAVADEIATYVRTKIEPEELVDLWNVVFPPDQRVYYDEEDGVVIYKQEEPWYAEQ